MSEERPQDFPRYGSQPPHAQQQPYPPAPYPAMGVQQRDNSSATVALVLGIAAFATGILLISPFAWWMGKKAMNEIDDAPGAYGNRGMAVAGYVMGIIGSVLLGLFILGMLAFIVFVFSL